MDKRDIHSTDGMRPNAPSQTRAAAQPAYQRKARGNRKLLWIIGLIILVGALIGAGYYLLSKSQIDSSKYQAVFLTNGQVYFGKLHDYYTERPYLTDVYYIQAPNGQNADDASAAATADATNQQLVKLGSEVHGPENKLILNKPSILFVENLTEEGKVVQLINQGEDKK